MGHEDQTQSNTSSGNNNIICRSSKRIRPKKVPQRGLGVAQLEKIRLEEQQKNDSSSSLAPDVSHPSSIFRQPLSVQNTVPLTSGHKFWGSCCEFNIEKGCSGLDPGWVFKTNLSLPYENEPIWPLPTTSMVNLSSRTLSSTSVMNFQMEPPSNQSYYKNYKPLLPEEEKVIGMKRSYPFSIDNALGPPIHTKYHHINGQVEATSSSKASTFRFESEISNCREGPSCSTSNGVFGRDFLTLAPPTTTSMRSTSKSKHPTSNSISYELPGIYSLAYHQESFEDSIMKEGGRGLNKHRPYYSFFPPAMPQIDRATSISLANCKDGEVGGHVDLNLKL